MTKSISTESSVLEKAWAHRTKIAIVVAGSIFGGSLWGIFPYVAGRDTQFEIDRKQEFQRNFEAVANGVKVFKCEASKAEAAANSNETSASMRVAVFSHIRGCKLVVR